jgi:hypothetical protein
MNHQGKTPFFLKLLQKALPFDETIKYKSSIYILLLNSIFFFRKNRMNHYLFLKKKDNVTFSEKSKDFLENDPN